MKYIILCAGIAIGLLLGAAINPPTARAGSGYIHVNMEEVTKNTRLVSGYHVLGFSCVSDSCYVLTEGLE